MQFSEELIGRQVDKVRTNEKTYNEANQAFLACFLKIQKTPSCGRVVCSEQSIIIRPLNPIRPGGGAIFPPNL